MIDLKPCPFCGGDAELKTWWAGLGVRRYIHRVQCSKCRCNSGDWKIKPKAVEAWNRRAGEQDG